MGNGLIDALGLQNPFYALPICVVVVKGSMRRARHFRLTENGPLHASYVASLPYFTTTFGSSYNSGWEMKQDKTEHVCFPLSFIRVIDSQAFCSII